MTEIEMTLAECGRSRRRWGVSRADKDAMTAELRSDLMEADAAGAELRSIVGVDVAAFAHEWAASRGVVRPRWRLVSTSLAALVGMLPAAGFAVVLPLAETSGWAVEFLVDVFPGQRGRTHLNCVPTPNSICPSPFWTPPGWLIAAWFGLATVLVFVGAVMTAPAWLRRLGVPAAAATRRALTIGLPLAGALVGIPLIAYNQAGPCTVIGDGLWLPALVVGALATVAGARSAAVFNTRRTRPSVI